MKIWLWRLIPLFLFTLLVIGFWRGLSLDPHDLPSARINQPLPSFQLPHVLDASLAFSSHDLQGKVCLLNVWASWCEACKQEQPFLLQLKREGVQIYGLNYKDNREDAIAWLHLWGNPYQSIGSDLSGKMGIDLGVYGAPETFLIDKQGIIRYRHVGILDEKIWYEAFLPRIKQWEHATL